MNVFNLKLSDFDGPFDLLLTLVKENKMDIQNINILTIADQYLKFVYGNQDIEINEASEYLLIASTLVWLKSKTILSTTLKLSDEEQAQIDIERQKLINQILLYKKYRDLVPKFNEFASNRSKLLSKNPDDVERVIGKQIDKEVYDIPNQINFLVLQKAMQKAYDKWRLNIFTNRKIIVQEVSAEQVEKDIIKLLDKYSQIKKCSLSDFFQLIDEDTLSDQYLVTCFVCLLDLAKTGKIALTQNKFEDDITIEIL